MTAKKTPAKKAPPRKAPAKAPAKKTPAKKAPAKKSSPTATPAPPPPQPDLHTRTERLVSKSIAELEEMVESGTPEAKLSAITKLMPLINQAYNAREEEDELAVMKVDFADLMREVREYLTSASPDVEIDEGQQLGPVKTIDIDAA